MEGAPAIPDGYKDMILMKFGVHAQKSAEVRDKYETYLDDCINKEETQMEFAGVKMEKFQAADANNDGALDFAEFKEYHNLMGLWNDEKFGGHDEFSEEQFK